MQNQKHERLTAEWRRRLYSYESTVCPVSNEKKPSMIYPHEKTVLLRYSFWKDLIRHVISNDKQERNSCQLRLTRYKAKLGRIED